MGNTAAANRERHKSGETCVLPPSPLKDGQVFDFTKKKGRILCQSSLEEHEEPKDAEALLNSARMVAMVANTDGKDVLPTVFKWDGGGKQVFISGTFNNWKTIPMSKSHGDFVTILDLPEGEHQFKFQVDGQWVHDPGMSIIDNGLGSKNNVIKVKKTDFEVFDALATDSVASPTPQLLVSGSPPGDYCQDVPERKPNEKVPGPPILPPHLLQVILNKDVPVSCEPTLLPEPNHVMLNHLYALSIKDGVMVLSATHRYRKKCVTTLLYKPI